MSDETISEFLPTLVAIRHRLHQMPELGLSEHKTSSFIAEVLESWGLESPGVLPKRVSSPHGEGRAKADQ